MIGQQIREALDYPLKMSARKAYEMAPSICESIENGLRAMDNACGCEVTFKSNLEAFQQLTSIGLDICDAVGEIGKLLRQRRSKPDVDDIMLKIVKGLTRQERSHIWCDPDTEWDVLLENSDHCGLFERLPKVLFLLGEKPGQPERR